MRRDARDIVRRMPGSPFAERVRDLPVLGVGVSTEYGVGRGAGSLDLEGLRREHATYAGFLEVGVEVARGLDDDARAWAAAGLPTTYHFLDVNLDEPEDLDAAWLADVRAIVDTLDPGSPICWLTGCWSPGE